MFILLYFYCKLETIKKLSKQATDKNPYLHKFNCSNGLTGNPKTTPT